MSSSKVRETRFLTGLKKEKRDIHMLCQTVIANRRAMDDRWSHHFLTILRFTHLCCKCVCVLPT